MTIALGRVALPAAGAYTWLMRYVEVKIAVDADDCYRRLCDIESVPQWVPAVAEVRVRKRDDAGRICEAQFIGGRGSIGMSYVLTYTYDDANRALRWQIDDAALRELEGEAQVSDRGAGRCVLRYGLHASTLSFRGGGLHLEDEVPEEVAESFRRWVETT